MDGSLHYCCINNRLQVTSLVADGLKWSGLSFIMLQLLDDWREHLCTSEVKASFFTTFTEKYRN